MKLHRPNAVCALLCAALVAPPSVWPLLGVADAAPKSAERTAEKKARSAALQEAQARFQRGVELYADEDYGAALVEFRRAYELVPNYRILYNLGQVAYQQHDYVAALDHFSRYLAEGGAKLPPQRRREVEEEVQRLTQRVGAIEISVDEDGAEIALDDVVIGRSPLPDKVTVNVGRHRVRVTAMGAPPTVHVVDVPGATTVPLRVEVRPPTPPPAAPPAPVALAPRRAGPPPELALTSKTPAASSESHTWIGWTAAGVLAVGAGVAAAVALDAANERDRLRDTYPASASRLDSVQRRLRGAALIADTLLVGAGLAAALTLSVSLFDDAPPPPRKDRGKSKGRGTTTSASTIRLELAPAGAGGLGGQIGLGGRF